MNVYALVPTIVLLTCLNLAAQDENRFRNFQGFKDPERGMQYLGAEGYYIVIQPASMGVEGKAFEKWLKKQDKNAKLIADTAIHKENSKALIASWEDSGVTFFRIYYLLPESANRSVLVSFEGAGARDIDLEHDFVNSYIADRIPSFIYTKREIDAIDFAGRTIELGPACQWMKPHNIQCPDLGQMNWEMFDTQEAAESYRDRHHTIARSGALVKEMEEEWVTVKFEGQETKALRTRMKVKLPRVVMGGSNVLVVYYVAAAVRGKYVACVLSHYTDDVGAGKLPPLLAEVMELPTVAK
jgi:hypothetical protein